MRPVTGGMCKFESLVDGTLDLYHVGLMNDHMDVEDENRRRVNEWLKNHKA